MLLYSTLFTFYDELCTIVTLSLLVGLPISLSFIDEMKKIEQKCMLVEEASVNVLSSDMNETDTSVLKNLLTRADSIPLVIPSRSFLLFASRCMELVNRYQEITSKDSHGKVPQIHIWDVFSLATSCGSILDEYEQWYAVNTPVSSRGARHSLQKSVPKTYKLVNALVTRIRDELHVKLVAMKEDSTQFRNNTIKFLMKK